MLVVIKTGLRLSADRFASIPASDRQNGLPTYEILTNAAAGER